MNQLTDTLRDSKRIRLIATALELMQYERTDSAVIPIPGTEPQRYVVVGTAATVARLLEIDRPELSGNSGDLGESAGSRPQASPEAPASEQQAGASTGRQWVRIPPPLVYPYDKATTVSASDGISDAEIAGIMGWRGPGAYTESTLRKIKRVIEVDRAALARAPLPAQAVDVARDAELIELLKVIRPSYGAVGSRDVDVTAQQKRIDRAIELLPRTNITGDSKE